MAGGSLMMSYAMPAVTKKYDSSTSAHTRCGLGSSNSSTCGWVRTMGGGISACLATKEQGRYVQQASCTSVVVHTAHTTVGRVPVVSQKKVTVLLLLLLMDAVRTRGDEAMSWA
jgi:hypothetical protein